jgi:hypothetical protein
VGFDGSKEQRAESNEESTECREQKAYSTFGRIGKRDLTTESREYRERRAEYTYDRA